jgi:hypothetical protein
VIFDPELDSELSIPLLTLNFPHCVEERASVIFDPRLIFLGALVRPTQERILKYEHQKNIKKLRNEFFSCITYTSM